MKEKEKSAKKKGTSAADSLSRRLLDSRRALIEFAQKHTLRELVDRALEETGEYVHSPIGFFHFIDADSESSFPLVWSTRSHGEFCRSQNRGIHSPKGEGGVWTDCIREGKAVIQNDYDSLPDRAGLPEGHVPVKRELVVPVKRSGKIVAVMGVGNKPEDYTPKDLEVVTQMADIAWQVISLKKIRADLRESEDRFRRVYDHMAVGVAQVSLDFHLLSANHSYCRMLGYREEELIGTHLREITDPSDLEENLIKQAKLSHGEIDHFRMEKRFTHKSGRVVFGILDANLVRDPEGRPLYILGSVLDITDRERAEEALWESEVRNRAILDALPDLMFVQHRDGTFLDYHAPQGGVLFVSPRQFMGNRIQELLPEKFSAKALEVIRNVLESGRIQVYEYELPIDGEVRHFEARVVPYGEEKVLSIIREITKRKVAEERTARFGRILEDSLNEIYLFDAETLNFTQVNRAAQQNLGYSMEELLKLTPIDIKPKITVRSFQDLVAPLRQGVREKIVFETTHKRKDGSHYDVEVHLQLLKYGRESQFAAIISDITERKQGEAERLRLEEQFHRAQRLESIGRLAGGIAHDLNNLLTPILGYGEMLLQREDDGASGEEPVREIVNAGRRARDLVHQLLVFSRRQPLEFRPLDLNALLADFEKLLRRTLREDISLRIDPALELPRVSGDTGQLEQVIMNLAVNAQDAMPDGGTLTIGTDQTILKKSDLYGREDLLPGPFVLLTIADTGIGIDDETRRHMFEPFFTTKDKERGTGLGLSTVYGIVKQHGGLIRVVSGPGRGSEFRIFLPVSDHEPEPEKINDPVPALLKGTETVLLVEDSEQVRSLIRAILARQGYSVLMAEDGAQALSLVKEYPDPVHLMLTDVIMPGMNGQELFRRISAMRPGVKVIYMSGYANDVVMEEGGVDPAPAFIQKPFTVADITVKVREVLDQK